MSLLRVKCTEDLQPLHPHAFPGLDRPLQLGFTTLSILHHVDHDGELGGAWSMHQGSCSWTRLRIESLLVVLLTTRRS